MFGFATLIHEVVSVPLAPCVCLTQNSLCSSDWIFQTLCVANRLPWRRSPQLVGPPADLSWKGHGSRSSSRYSWPEWARTPPYNRLGWQGVVVFVVVKATQKCPTR